MLRGLRLLLLSLLLPLTAAAAVFVPEELQGWEGWVLQDRQYRDCPFFFNTGAAERDDFVCAWPGQLEIAVTSQSARFTQQWAVYADSAWLPLPGDSAYWPQDVTVNGDQVPVVERDGAPSLWLGPGSYRIAGRFEWDERPGALRVPDQIGLIALVVDGNRVSRPERNGSGLFLAERQRELQARDGVRTQGYRLVEDDVPTRLTMLLQIDVSGGVREELFGPALPDGFVPMALSSQLPARLEANGQLRVQVRPGRWELTLIARAPEVMNEITLPAATVNLPAAEVWSYRSNDNLRITSVEGGTPVDPGQAQVPERWRALPAFRLEAGEGLVLIERSRGIVAAENELYLSRNMWLDFDGSGFIVHDRISGTMRTDWRLDMVSPYRLLGAAEAGENLLITQGDKADHSGVEIRRTAVDLTGLGRSDTRAEMPVTGWNARFVNVEAWLNLPPGDKLLWAPGVDSAPGSWASRWQLLDFFLVLIVTIAVWRLAGPAAGCIALPALVLSFHEIGAPSWLWLNLLAAVALVRVAPPGRLRQFVGVYQGLSVVVVLLVLVPFIGNQLRLAIYPQLEPQYGSPFPDFRDLRANLAYPSAAPGWEPAAERQEADAVVGTAQELATLAAPKRAVESAIQAPNRYSRHVPGAVVQAGPGVPSWAWNNYRLTWSGPVDAAQAMRLVVLARWAVTVLRFLEVALLLLFAAMLASLIFRRGWRLPGGLRLGATPTAALLAVGLLGTGIVMPPQAEAQTPSSELLRQLETRLLKPPQCVPRCAEIAAVVVDATTDSISMKLTVQALEAVAIPLPGSENGWRPDAILLDGSTAAQLLRGPDTALWLRVAAGRHDVVLRGAALDVDSLEIPFFTPPRVIQVKSAGWLVAGVKDRRLLSGSLQLTRERPQSSSETIAPTWESGRFPAFAQVERNIELDLDWRATTTVRRLAPAQGALTLEVPLLDGEQVLTDNMDVSGGRILVSLAPDQQSAFWSSSLPRKSPFALEAPAGAAWKEVWRIGVGSIWHAQFSGLAESETQGSFGVRNAEFHPRGGERMTMTTMRPEAVPGSTLAFDVARINVEQGERSQTATLSLTYRSTRGAQHVVRLPDGAEITEVRIDQRAEPLRAEADELTLPILPGEHQVTVVWRTATAAGTLLRTPAVDLRAQASNISLNLNLPANRWLLGTAGPRLGPAVLYWSELAVLALFALILGRIDWTPLKTRHWLLLGLGFSTFSWLVFAAVVVWLLLCGARDKWRGTMSELVYNLSQIVIAATTAIALLAIVISLPVGLLGVPEMHVSGNGSQGNALSWFADRSASLLPQATAVTVPLWLYKAFILLWALWLSFALLGWLRWAWQTFVREAIWKSRKQDSAPDL